MRRTRTVGFALCGYRLGRLSRCWLDDETVRGKGVVARRLKAGGRA
jgi:hypothetical protein